MTKYFLYSSLNFVYLFMDLFLHLDMPEESRGDTEEQQKLNLVQKHFLKNHIHKLVLASLNRVSTILILCLFVITWNAKFLVLGEFFSELSF